MEERRNHRIIRIAVLVVISLQSACHSISTNYSRGIKRETYSPLEVIAVAEIMKLIVSGTLTVVEMKDTNRFLTKLYKLMRLILSGRRVAVLVIMYSISNVLPFFAIPIIGAPIYSVVTQMKIFLTAVFATVLLGRSYSAAKWRALALLVVGCVLVSSPMFAPGCEETTNIKGDKGGQEDKSVSPVMAVLGLAATLLQACISALSSVYFEGLLKDKDAELSIWERNFQLAFYSIVVVLLSMSAQHVSAAFRGRAQLHSLSLTFPGLFEGWTWLALLNATLLGLGGMLVAATLKYADAILKCFATAVSIIMISVAGHFILDSRIDVYVGIGMIVTVISIFNYALDYDPSVLQSK